MEILNIGKHMAFIGHIQQNMNIIFSAGFTLLWVFAITNTTFCKIKGEMGRYKTIKDREKI